MLQVTNVRHDLPDIEIGYSLVRLVGLMCLMLVMLLLSASAALDWLPRKTGSQMAHIILGYAGIVLFGGGLWRLIGTLLEPRRPMIVINREGIRDIRTSHGLIPWQSVEAITLRQSRAQTVVILKIRPADAARFLTTRTTRFVAWSNKLLGVDGIMIGTMGLMMQTTELLDVCKTYHAAARGRVTANWR